MPSLATAADVTVRVAPDGGGDYTSIQDALAFTSPDDNVTISIAPGVYAPVAVVRGGNVTIRPSEQIGNAFLQGIEVVDAGAAVTITGVSMTSEGADIQRGALTLENLSLSNPGVSGKPAVRVAPGASASLDTVLIESWGGSQAPIQVGPGASAAFDMVGIFNSEGTKAGAIWSRGATLNINTLLTIDTRAMEGTGALNIDGGTVTMTDSRIEGASGLRGGGIRIAGNATVTTADMVFEDNDAPDGGHIRMESGSLSMVRTVAEGGSANYGGVIWQGGGNIEVRNASFYDNQALAAGSGVYQQDGSIEMAFATWTAMGSGYGASAHNGPSTAVYHGVIIADTEGPAFNIGTEAAVSFNQGLIWKIGADAAVEGGLDFDPNSAFNAPRFADAKTGDFALRAISAGIDLGVLGETDPDGTAADAGMYGGADAWSLADLDGDGFVHGRDCIDTDATVNESATDVFYDGIDSNCDELSDYDQDGDGFDTVKYGGTDCADTDAMVYPGAIEAGGDNLDGDCDGFDFPDADADGWPADLDCDDTSADIAPDAIDPWYDGIDQDCAGNNDFDQDGDGYESAVYGGRDCDDTDPQRHPMYPDFAGDGIDQDCDGYDAVVEAAPEEEVNQLSPYTEPDDGLAPAAMGETGDKSSAVVSAGCSVTNAAGSGPLGVLGLVSLFGLIARRRD